MATNDFVPFCPTDTGTNLLSQANYLTDPQLPIGNQPGIARLQLVNKALRQATYIASCVAQFLSNATGDNVLDDATPPEILATMAKVWPSPTGTLLAFAGSVAPAGFLLADGSSKLRTDFPALFAVIGTTYGSVDGTHFNLPDTRGVFLRGAGTQTIAGVTYTGTQGTTENDAMQGHVHPQVGNTIAGGGPGVLASPPDGVQFAIHNTGDPAVDTHGNGTPRTGAETQPANICVAYIIKT